MANVVSEVESFSVRSPGMGSTAFSLGMGAQYNVNNKLTLSAYYRKSMDNNAQNSNAFFLNAVLGF
jgi:outer membrane autotransporter protein